MTGIPEFINEGIEDIKASLTSRDFEHMHLPVIGTASELHRFTHRDLGLRVDVSLGICQLPGQYGVYAVIYERTKKGGYSIRHYEGFVFYDSDNQYKASERRDNLKAMVAQHSVAPGCPLGEVQRTPPNRIEAINNLPPQEFKPTPKFIRDNGGQTLITPGAQAAAYGVARSAILTTATVKKMGVLTTNNKKRRTAFIATDYAAPDSDIWFLMSCGVAGVSLKMTIITDGEFWYPAHSSTVYNAQVSIPDDLDFAHGKSCYFKFTHLTLDDQLLIQAAIAFYVTGQI